MHFNDDLADALASIIMESGKRIRDERDFRVDTKGSRENIVTSADIANEGFLKERLLALLPGSVFIGEEGDEGNVSEKGYTWIVDPIDGTANYARHLPLSVVSIALLKDGRPYIGMVYNPFTDELFEGKDGCGAYRNGVPMHVSKRPLENCMMCTAWCTYHKENSPVCFRVSERMHPMIEDIRRIGTAAYELCLLANGSADLYYEFNLSPWDYAAGLICLKEAGGCFTGTFEDIRYDRQGPVVAANNKDNLNILLNVVREETERS